MNNFYDYQVGLHFMYIYGKINMVKIMKFVTDISEKEYVEFEENHVKAHFLESYAWGCFAKKGKKQDPIFVGLKDENNKLLCAALFLKKSLPFKYSYIYSPRGYVIDFKNKELLKTFTEEIKKYMKANKIIYVKIDPDIKYQTIDENAQKIDGENNYDLYNYLLSLGYKHKGFNKLYEGNQPRYTFRINLENKTKEDLDNIFNKSFLKSVKRSYNYDLRIDNNKCVHDFYNLIQYNSNKDGFHSYSEEYYKAFTEEFSKYNNVKYFNAYINPKKVYDKLTKEEQELTLKIEKDKKHAADLKNQLERKQKEKEIFNKNEDKDILVCSLICVYTKKKAWSLYIGNNELGNFTFAVSRCYYDSIIDALNNGYLFYDLFGTVGDPKTKYKNLAHLHDFKRKFGDEYIEFIGEFDLVNNKILYKLLPIMLKIYRKIKR